jgi:putative ABC transport system permease protein
MLRVALKGLLGHKLRFALTTLAVVLGVTFVAGSFVLTDSIERAFGTLLNTAYETSDLVVRGQAPIDDITVEQPGQGPTVPASVVDEIAAVDGVAVVDGFVQDSARIVGADGEPIGIPGPPKFGVSWSDQPGPLTLKEGDPPRGPDEVAVDAVSADQGELQIGDEIEIILPTGVETFTLVGITGFGDSDNLLGATMAVFDLGTAQALFDKEGRFDEVAVVAAEDVQVTTLRDRVTAAIGDDFEVVTVADRINQDQESIGTALGFINTALLAFAAVALFVGAFIIANTFTIVVAQRLREFALLRAVGASSRQVRLAVLVEALAVGVLASTLGLLLGIGFASLLRSLLAGFGLDLPSGELVVAGRTVVASYLVGMVVTAAAALGPARRASRVAPVEAMRGAAVAEGGLSRRRSLGGAVLVVAGAVLLGVGLALDVDDRIAYVGAGAFVSMLGVAALAPLVADPFARLVGAAMDRLGVAGRLATGNARRNPKRTAATASALMIGLALVSFVTILAASISATVNDLLAEQFRADFILRADEFATMPIPDQLVEELRSDPAIGPVSGLTWTQVLEDEQQRGISAVDPDTIEQLLALGVEQGEVSRLARPDTLFVQTEALADAGRSVGDTVPVTFPSGEEVELTVIGTFEASDFVGGTYVVGEATLRSHVASARPGVLLAGAAGDLEAARGTIDAVEDAFPGVNAQDQAEFRQEQEDQIGQLLGLMMVLLALAIVIALLGIANTLALSVFERTREVGLLRAVGMTRRQVRRMVRWESVIVALFGAVLGLVVGTGFGWAVVTALEEEGIDRLVIPGGQLAIYVVAAGVAGVVAAVFPAWRAARLDVLRAVTSE